mgnify:CR=1 FL=1
MISVHPSDTPTQVSRARNKRYWYGILRWCLVLPFIFLIIMIPVYVYFERVLKNSPSSQQPVKKTDSPCQGEYPTCLVSGSVLEVSPTAGKVSKGQSLMQERPSSDMAEVRVMALLIVIMVIMVILMAALFLCCCCYNDNVGEYDYWCYGSCLLRPDQDEQSQKVAISQAEEGTHLDQTTEESEECCLSPAVICVLLLATALCIMGFGWAFRDNILSLNLETNNNPTSNNPDLHKSPIPADTPNTTITTTAITTPPSSNPPVPSDFDRLMADVAKVKKAVGEFCLDDAAGPAENFYFTVLRTIVKPDEPYIFKVPRVFKAVFDVEFSSDIDAEVYKKAWLNKLANRAQPLPDFLDGSGFIDVSIREDDPMSISIAKDVLKIAQDLIIWINEADADASDDDSNDETEENAES